MAWLATFTALRGSAREISARTHHYHLLISFCPLSYCMTPRTPLKSIWSPICTQNFLLRLTVSRRTRLDITIRRFTIVCPFWLDQLVTKNQILVFTFMLLSQLKREETAWLFLFFDCDNNLKSKHQN